MQWRVTPHIFETEKFGPSYCETIGYQSSGNRLEISANIGSEIQAQDNLESSVRVERSLVYFTPHSNSAVKNQRGPGNLPGPLWSGRI